MDIIKVKGITYFSVKSDAIKPKQTNSVAISPQASYTD
jgi:hypothetical protein